MYSALDQQIDFVEFALSTYYKPLIIHTDILIVLKTVGNTGKKLKIAAPAYLPQKEERSQNTETRFRTYLPGFSACGLPLTRCKVSILSISVYNWVAVS